MAGCTRGAASRSGKLATALALLGLLATACTPSTAPPPATSSEPPTLSPNLTPPGQSAPASSLPAGPSSTAPEQGGSLEGLARVPWDGGPEFWKKFAKADAAGWDDPAFFPIGVWYASANGPQMQFDKAHGINFYVQFNPDTDHRLFEQNGMFSLMRPKDAPLDWGQLPGNYIDDEVDGRFGWDEGVAHMYRTVEEAKSKEQGRFTYANWTPSLISYDAPMDITRRYWETVDVSSTSNYYYAGACRDWRLRTPTGYNPTTTATCQTASAYAKAMQIQQEVNIARGVHTPIWSLPTVLSPEGEHDLSDQMTAERVKAQVWAMLIHESRGIVWFTQSPGGGDSNPCMSGDALADVRISNRDCARDQVRAMGEVNAEVKALAPVLNTQSYVWRFGDSLDTMLKVKDGSAYIFAMTQDATTGERTFKLPDGINGTRVEVLNENRTISAENGAFTDTFAKESVHHVYKIAL
ncbi:hypothetical protein AB0N65_14175 [Paenarthrobacter sp. NPDC089322]|uniref:hypothetical protein n=1 Tax=Paenarthrobacter sp. NPDC089322 TaxID=3155065 RepID=UPI003441C1FD